MALSTHQHDRSTSPAGRWWITIVLALVACSQPTPQPNSPSPLPASPATLVSPSPTPGASIGPVSGVTTTATGALRGDVAWVVRETSVPRANANPSLRFELIAVPVIGGAERVAVTWERTQAAVGPATPRPVARRQLSPDGRRFAFAPTSRRIVVVDLETGVAHQITSDAEYQDDSPSWSRDGTLIAFRRARSGLEAGIWVANADGTAVRRVIAGDPQRVDGSLPVYDWTPDGEVICYSEPLQQYRCVRVRDGAQVFDDGNVSGPAPAEWRRTSPELVIATTQRGAGTSSLYAVNRNLQSQPRVIATGRAAEIEYLSPRWHPTADEVAYVEARTFAGQQGPILGLFLSSLDGTRRSVGTNGSPREPEWSPAGDEVLFLGGEGIGTASPLNIGLFATRSDGSLYRTVWLARGLVSLATRRY